MHIERNQRRDLEVTEVNTELSQVSNSQASQVGYVAQQFIPRNISNCSRDCKRDVFFTVLAGAVSVMAGLAAAENSTVRSKVAYAFVSAILGLFSTGMTIYGVTIRCCPRSQRFWLR